MNPTLCLCRRCGRPHYQQLTDEERKSLFSIKGSIDSKGNLIMACDKCSPFKYSNPIEEEWKEMDKK